MARHLNKLHPDSPIYIGIDAGTSGMRACCIDDQATLLVQASIAFPGPVVDDNEVAQDPQIWADTLSDLILQLKQAISLESLKAIAIDGTSGTVFFCDAKGRPLSRALMYNDARSGHQVAQLKTITDNTTVQSVSAGLPKLMWLIENTAQDTATTLMHQADWLNFQLTQTAGHSDVNNCLKTGYDPIHHQWPDWFSALPALQAKLPQVHRPGEVMGTIAATVAKRLGLPVDTQIMAGTTDSHAAILATGISQPGEAVTSLGSTLVVKIICETPIFNQQYGIYSQPFGDYWLVGGGSNTGGAVLREYFSDQEMESLSLQINPNVDTELGYYPLLKTGERFPINDPMLTPKLSPRPDNNVIFLQGLFEGIARIEFNAYQKLAELGAPYPDVIYTAGGGAKNQVWTEIRQRYCQTKIKQSQYNEACYGSAILAKSGHQQ
ncbi:Carbohydrate kinase, FGGY family [hydrothermal vent metagenome]|uniref:Carbohydrate kinase, FGGY family n=1 Tax=hydrothermal vent metagenome TaxID=652676 RepID=A0A3B0ZP00_9ZZZZ